ncbi:TolC family protein [Psychroserpens ponticola]|uniref:TolC family protein n=1 Tax=Psychroserpens ponticola TaxID=2932268 RepID=A0ABY7S023_9FLAO|nr:TolC family protein [Psychroserpens ponticola]WCO02315.1 TolC family protein [Psychroserpens ponticola]
MKQKTIIYAFMMMMVWGGFAQSELEISYSLEECLSMALKNNLDLKSTHLNADREKVNHQRSKANLLPSINGDFNLGVNRGRSIDPFTNDFINQEFTFSNVGLNLDATIFNGFRLINTVKQNQLNRLASEMENEAVKQDLVLRVTLAYLQVSNSKDNLRLAKQRLETTEKQMKIQEDFYNNEVGNPADFTDIVAQKAIDETSIVVAEIGLNNAKLSLTRLLNINNELTLDTEDLLLDIDHYAFSADQVYADALKNMATFKANELRVDAAKKGVSIAKAQFTPEFSVFAGVNSNYSSAAQIFSEIGSSITPTGDFVTVNGQDFPVLTHQSSFSSEGIPYKEQLDNNLSTVVGVAVNVPLFNGLRAKNNVALEKVRVEESILELERTHLDIKNAIAQVHFEMNAAYLRYQSLAKQVEAFEESYRVNEIRFNNGISNFLNYVTSKNNLDNAKVNFTNAKYEYILRVKVLEYYRGNMFQLENTI